ncbi:MAG: hypothetical protein J7527_12090, partial [Chitinophagaceae bacterium]|nr:hypothetical protein [Chitinophagaceae bacterium]
MLKASIYFNSDDCFLAWDMPFRHNCAGFAIYKEQVRANGEKYEGFIHNRTGFASDQHAPRSHKSSAEWPFQRYTWTDHLVDDGDTVTYTIYPVMKNGTKLEVDQTTKAKAGPVTLSSGGDGKTDAYFNRGILLSQFITSKLPKDWTKSDLLALKKSLEKDDDELRHFLMGPLGAKLLNLLDTAIQKGWHVYGALYELDDDILISKLKKIGKKAHLVLANGSTKKKGEDGNKKAANALKTSVDLHRRMLWSEGLAHNKFLVFARTKEEPFLVWTGSTNWATTGLCTQLNNGILLEDKKLASTYLDHWKLLRDDERIGRSNSKMHFGDALMESNNEPKSGNAKAIGNWTVWFTRTTESQDMEAVTTLINNAKEAILFLMFEPGNNGLLQVVQSRLSPASATYDKNLYIHGVVNTLKKNAPGKGEDVAVELVGRGTNKSFNLKVVEPTGVNGLPGWADEVMRRDFIMGQGGVIGHAIIHSK